MLMELLFGESIEFEIFNVNWEGAFEFSKALFSKNTTILYTKIVYLHVLH